MGAFIDFFLSLRVPIANQPYMLILQGLVFAVIYYFLFRFLIVKFNLKTPGREDDPVAVGEGVLGESTATAGASGSKFANMAAIIYEGLGEMQMSLVLTIVLPA